MIYDDEGRMMTGTDHHYTDESIRARIEQLRRFASGSHESAVEWINLDWRGFCNTTRHILSSLYAALASEQTEAYAEGRKDEREQWVLVARQALNALNTCDGDKDGYKGPVQWFDDDAVNAAIVGLSEVLADGEQSREDFDNGPLSDCGPA